MKYNHAFSFAFEMDSTTEDGSEITAEQLRSAIVAYLDNLHDDDLLSNCGAPFDTIEIED